MLWLSGQQWAMLHQELPYWQTVAIVALVTISTATLRLYDDQHRLMTKNTKTEQVLVEATKKAEMVRGLESALWDEETGFRTLHQESLDIVDIEPLLKDICAFRKPQSIFFFDLPAELRDRIYDMVAFAAVGNKPRTLYHSSINLIDPKATIFADPPLALVNRQCRSEYLPRYFRATSMIMHGPIGCCTDRALRFFAHRLPMIRSFELWMYNIAGYRIRFSGDIERPEDGLPKLPSQQEGYAIALCRDSWLYERSLKRFEGQIDARMLKILQSSLLWKDGVACMSMEGLCRISDFLSRLTELSYSCRLPPE